MLLFQDHTLHNFFKSKPNFVFLLFYILTRLGHFYISKYYTEYQYIFILNNFNLYRCISVQNQVLYNNESSIIGSENLHCVKVYTRNYRSPHKKKSQFLKCWGTRYVSKIKNEPFQKHFWNHLHEQRMGWYNSVGKKYFSFVSVELLVLDLKKNV